MLAYGADGGVAEGAPGVSEGEGEEGEDEAVGATHFG